MTAPGLRVAVALVLFAAAAACLLLAVYWHRHPRPPGRHEAKFLFISIACRDGDHDLCDRCDCQHHLAGGDEADTFIGELRGLPAAGLDYISDRHVRLPFTPTPVRCSDPPEESCADAGCPVHGWDDDAEPYETDDDFIDSVAPLLPSEATLTTAELDELKARWAAAQGHPPIIMPPPQVTISTPCYYDNCGECQAGECDCACHQPPSVEVEESAEPFDERAMWGEHWGQPGEPGERLASDTDVRTVTCAAPARPAGMEPVGNPVGNPAGVLPGWVVEALGGHTGVDACLDSIVARSETDA